MATDYGVFKWPSEGSGTGSVTSVGLSMPSIFTVTGSPVTTSGTLTATLNTESANTVFSGPTTGAAVIPTFRSLVLADLPNLNATNIGYTPTTSSDWSTVPTNVGLALDDLASSGIFKSQAQNLFLASPDGSSGLPSFRAITSGDIPVPTGVSNTFAGFDNSGNLESVPGFTIDTTSGGMTINLTQQPNNGGGGTVNNGVFSFDPLQNSPNENWNIYNLGVNFDVNNSGFSQGTNGNAVQLLNLGFNHSNTGPIGQLVYLNLTGNIGNGTDPLTTNGMVVSAVGLNYHANVTLNNAIQGYTFSSVVDAAAIAGTNFGVTAFSDSSNIGISVDGYSSANFNPNIAQISANHGLTGLNFNPMVTTMGANAFVHGMDIGGTITTSHGDVSGINITPIINGGDASFHGLNISPSGTATLASVNGINIDLSNLASPNIKNGLSINGASINVASPYDTSVLSATPGEFQNNSLGGEFHIAAGHPMSASFGFGNNLGFTLLAEDDMVADNFLGSSSLGFSLNGFVNQIVVLSGKTVDTVNYMAAGGSSNAFSTGGTIANVSMFRALGVLNGGGTLNITNMYGFKAEPSISGLNPTNTWGVWVGDTNADNWFAKNVVIGGVTGKPVGSEALSVTGTSLLSGDVDVDTHQIHNVVDPTLAQDAATKNYVDTTTLSSSLMTTAGDIIYENITPAPARLPIGSTGDILTVAGGLPTWAPPAAVASNTYDLIVGPAQIYTTIGAAITAASAGQSIFIQTGTYTENPVVDKQLNITGSGRGVVISGSLTFDTGSDESLMTQFKVTSGFTINSGVNGVMATNWWNGSASTYTDNGTGTYVQLIQE